MNILYLGSFFPDSRYEEIVSNSAGFIQNAGDTYQKGILAGLSLHDNNYTIITSPMIGSFPSRYKRKYFKGSSFNIYGLKDCTCSGFCNISLYKIYSRYYNAKIHLKNWAKNTSGVKKIIVYSLDLPLVRAACEIKKEYSNINVCLVITDFIRFMPAPNNFIWKSAMSYFDKKLSDYYENIDNFVLLTEYMKNDLPLDGRPYVVVEGIYNNEKIISKELVSKEKFKTILYTGALAKQFGIIHLLNAFSRIENKNYRLWICGDGDAKDEIIIRAKKDDRITYFGQVKREEAINLQKRATVLINPRLSDSEYTFYSFPSKTMEYLASGTPTIMHPLKCLPEEYLNHLFISNDETDVGLMNTIVDVCERTQEELNIFGEIALSFILEKKNSKIQVAKILDLMVYEK